MYEIFRLLAITVITILIPYHMKKSLLLAWRSQSWTKNVASSRMASCGSGLPAEWPFRSRNAIGQHLTHWGRVTHICVGILNIIGSDNGLSPERCQAIIWTNAGILLIEPLGTNFGEILIQIQAFSLNKIRLKMSSAKCCSFHLDLNVLSDLFVTVP